MSFPNNPPNFYFSYMCVYSFLIVVQSLSRFRLFATPWTVALQTSLSFNISLSLLKLMSIELVMPSNHLILYHPLVLLPSILPSIKVFPMNQLFASGGQSSGVSASTSVLPINIQGWFPLGLSDLLAIPKDSQESSSAPQFKSINTYSLRRSINTSPWRKKWQPTPVFMPGELHGQRSLVGCSAWGHKKSDMNEW